MSLAHKPSSLLAMTQPRGVTLLAAVFALMSLSSLAHAEANTTYWQAMQKDFFPNKTLQESSDIQISAPKRAESGAQVPFSFYIASPMTASSYIKSVSVIADANPVPLVAVYHFNPKSGRAEIATRIRLEVDSLVHVVAETSDGKFLVNQVTIRASGGCGGTIGSDEEAERQTAGKMKLQVRPLAAGLKETEAGSATTASAVSSDSNQHLKQAHLLIKHPMNTGLQRDLVSQGYRPAFYISKVVARFNDQIVFDADTYIGVSEDPSIQFPFKAEQSGKLTLQIEDNEGKQFSTSTEVMVN